MAIRQTFFLVHQPNGNYRIVTQFPFGFRYFKEWTIRGRTAIRAPDGELTEKQIEKFRLDISVSFGATVEEVDLLYEKTK